MVMMEMQDTINELQRELSALGKSAKQTKSRLSIARGSAVSTLSLSLYLSVSLTLSLCLFLFFSLRLSLSMYFFLSFFVLVTRSLDATSLSHCFFTFCCISVHYSLPSYLFIFSIELFPPHSCLFLFFYFSSPFLDTGLLSLFFLILTQSFICP